MGFSVRKEVPILKNPIDKEKVEESLKKLESTWISWIMMADWKLENELRNQLHCSPETTDANCGE